MTDVSLWPAERCPHCQETATVELRGDWRLCLSCDYEYAPSKTTGPLVAAPVLPGTVLMPPLVAVPDLDEHLDVAQQLAAARARFVGALVVVHDLGEQGTITEISDEGIATVEFGSGFMVYVEPDEFSPVEMPDVVTEQPEAVQLALAATATQVVAQVLHAARETITDDGDERQLGLPPNGWLPDVEGVMPVVEHGTAYAVAWLCITFGITSEQLEQSASAFDEAARAAKEATGQ